MDEKQKQQILAIHSKHQGVLEVASELPVTNKHELGQAYTPGVAYISRLLSKHPDLKEKYTLSGKLVALVTDGTAVLGLGDIGPTGGLPVVEGKALLYKDLAGVNAIPLALKQVSVDELADTLENISDSFAGLHLEDIAAPRCFELCEKLKERLNIPVYHDDQEGTAIVVLAGLINAAKVAGKKLTDLRIVINGVGAAGVAVARLLQASGITNLILMEKVGQVTAADTRFNKYQRAVAKASSNQERFADLSAAVAGADAFIGVSDANVLTTKDVTAMADNPIIFALANPNPEIAFDEVKTTKVKVFATGSSQYPNQVNNILAFPGLYRGLLQTDLKQIDLALQQKVAEGLADLVEVPSAENIIPSVFSDGVVNAVTNAVLAFAKEHN